MPSPARASATFVHSSALTRRPWTKTTGGTVLAAGPAARYSMRPCGMSMPVITPPRGSPVQDLSMRTACSEPLLTEFVSAQLLGQGEDDSARPAEIAEQVAVL